MNYSSFLPLHICNLPLLVRNLCSTVYFLIVQLQYICIVVSELLTLYQLRYRAYYNSPCLQYYRLYSFPKLLSVFLQITFDSLNVSCFHTFLPLFVLISLAEVPELLPLSPQNIATPSSGPSTDIPSTRRLSRTCQGSLYLILLHLVVRFLRAGTKQICPWIPSSGCCVRMLLSENNSKPNSGQNI